jgi:hypothetical protein
VTGEINFTAEMIENRRISCAITQGKMRFYGDNNGTFFRESLTIDE